MADGNTYQKDGDAGFIGLNSRDNPSALPQGYVSESINYRLDRGVASARKGLERKTVGSIVGKTIYGSTTYIDSVGQEIIVLITERDLWYYNPQSEVLSLPVPFPSRVNGGTFTSATIGTAPNVYTQITVTKTAHGYTSGNSLSIETSNLNYNGVYTITVTSSSEFTYVVPAFLVLTTGTCNMSIEYINTSDGCDVLQAVDNVFITRGYDKRPLRWNLGVSLVAIPASGGGHEFPNCSQLIYYGNRLIAQGKYHTGSIAERDKDSVSVSNYLDYQHWDILDVFTFNNGGNDQVTAVAPWTLNEFVVFMRNSIFYVNTGVGRYVTGAALSTDSFIKTLVTDIGCIAKRSVVQADGGVIFLSDNGVYIMNPTQVGANESMRLLTNAQPLSAPIDDVIQRINRTYAYRAVGVYWGNRYYLAVPVDGSAENNAVLVYNFILKAWESVDTYPAGIDVFNFVIAKKNNIRRLYIIDSDEGVFLTEELDGDEYGNNIGTPVLHETPPSVPYLPFYLGEDEFQSNLIQSSLTTRRYIFGTFSDKRFSGSEIDLLFQAGAVLDTYAEISNEDSTVLIDEYGSPTANDETRRTPIRKTGTGLQFRFVARNLRPAIRSVFAYGTVKGKNTQSQK
jgi:hypothetical protein